MKHLMLHDEIATICVPIHHIRSVSIVKDTKYAWYLTIRYGDELSWRELYADEKKVTQRFNDILKMIEEA